MTNECNWCEEEKDDLVFMRYEFEEGMYCQKCREEIANGAIDNYIKENIDYDYDYYPELPEEPLESKIRRQTQDSYGVCHICGKNRAFMNCSCV